MDLADEDEDDEKVCTDVLCLLMYSFLFTVY